MDSERDDETPEPGEPPAVFETSDADYDLLKAIADKRGYRLQQWGFYPVCWLEWRDGYSNPVKDPERYFSQKLTEFVPFVYWPAYADLGPSQSIPWATFIDSGQGWYGEDEVTERIADYVIALRRDGFQTDAEGRVAPGAVGWLIAERDALFSQVNRVAERLSASPSHWVHGSPPFHAVNAALRAWIVEAEIAVMGEPNPDADDPWAGHPHPMELPKEERAKMRQAHHYARHVWEGWVLGGVPSDKPFGDPDKAIDAFARFGVPRPVAVGTAAALTRSLGERDRILRGAAPIIARWVAAEEVLVRVFAGEALDSPRIVEAIQRRRRTWDTSEKVFEDTSVDLAGIGFYIKQTAHWLPYARTIYNAHAEAGKRTLTGEARLGLICERLDAEHGDHIQQRGLDTANLRPDHVRDAVRRALDMYEMPSGTPRRDKEGT